MGTAGDGRKLFVWGGLPGEDVTVQITKKKSKLLEGTVTEVHTPSPERITPADPDTYLSTSPWQIMSFEAEQRYKAQLIGEAFELHHVNLPGETEVYTDNMTSRYRNKVEFSWYSDVRDDGSETLDLAFFRRGSKGKVTLDDCVLLPEPMITLAQSIRDQLQSIGITARQLKTLLIRCDQAGNCVWQLYVKDRDISLSGSDLDKVAAQGGEVIYSDPRSPASRITERLSKAGNVTLTDTILDTEFRYVAEGFFQVNLPVYQQALRDMQQYVPDDAETVDMYSGVGTIGLTIGGDNCTLVEIDEYAVREMRRNIKALGSNAEAVLASAEQATEHITSDKTIIVDPPRAGLHASVVEQLLAALPPRIIYLSCNPATQARDVALLLDKYNITMHRGYNFFPRTPHIEHLVVLDAK